MGGDDALPEEEAPVRSPLSRALRWLRLAVLALAALLLAAVVFLHTPPGRQMIIDRIAGFAPASGLSIEVGRIEGSVLWSATFHDVKLSDAEGTMFLEVPEVDLNWRPWRWFTSGLDIRHLLIADGTLHAAPVFNPGDPDAPILPDFDIRVDHLVIEDLHVAPGLLGEERVIQFHTEADVRAGRVYLDAGGEFGGGDVFTLLVDAEPDRDLFDLALDWRAPAGGFLATIVGAPEEIGISLDGDGRWSSWQGDLLAQQGGEPLLDLDFYNEAGQFRLVGEVYPGPYTGGIGARALGETIAITASGTLEDSVLEGGMALRGRGLEMDANGGIDLADNRARDLTVIARLLDSTLLGEGVALRDARLEARVDGPFRALRVDHHLAVGAIDTGDVVISAVEQRATAMWDGSRAVIPLALSIDRVTSGNGLLDPRMVGGMAEGTLIYGDGRLASSDLALRFRGLAARLAMDGDLRGGRFRWAGPVRADDLPVEGIGSLDVEARVLFALGGGQPWSLDARAEASLAQVSSALLEGIAGDDIRLDGRFAVGQERPLSFTDLQLSASKLALRVDGEVSGGETTLAGEGEHADYGAFSLAATFGEDGPEAAFLFAEPLPAAGLRDVALALAPSSEGFALATSGQSALGPFDGTLGLLLPEDGPASLRVERLDLARSRVAGELEFVEHGLAGALDISRGGMDGRIDFSANDNGQLFAADLTARNARFGGATPLSLAQAEMQASGVLGAGRATIEASLTGQGIGYGSLFVGRMAGTAQIANGMGSFDAALAGRRGSLFELSFNGQVAPDRIAIAAEGSHAGQAITMPRRAVLLADGEGGWTLEPTQLGYGGGFAVLRGRFGGEAPAEARLSLSDMPLALGEVLADDLALGGTASGVVEYRQGAGGLPTGEARLVVSGLTRSGLLLTSRPMDIGVVASLSPELLQARAAIDDGGGANGRIEARIAGLPATGGLTERLYAGDLFAQMRFAGGAAALWRLTALDLLDVTGEVELAATARGTLADPQVRGTVAGDNLRVQSALTGMDISDVALRGEFEGSRLVLSRFAGRTANGGSVSGSGFVDLAGMNRERGPQIDIRMAARNARILDLPEMGASVTGPVRLVSSGVGGTIAGRVEVDSARWRLGSSTLAQQLPELAISEINLPADIAPPRRRGEPWRYLIDASAAGGIRVEGMGLDSEWRGEMILRGTTADPRIGGEAQIVARQGFYSFAGTRFEITRGRIEFDEGEPPDPRIDLVAETSVSDLSVVVSVQGDASMPDVTFTSVPALPEEEVLARLLFGGSVTDLSATDAVQLASALASLRGGAGIDPINRLRGAIGLDRLRIIPADPALDRATSVAFGKNISRRAYAELVTDGQGYNASELEFRLTSWLSLLGSISTLGRGAVAAEYSHDY